jgi:hypothetical protein
MESQHQSLLSSTMFALEQESASLKTTRQTQKDLESQLNAALQYMKDFDSVLLKTKQSYETQIDDLKTQANRQQLTATLRIDKLTLDYQDLEEQLQTEEKKVQSLTGKLQELR